MLSVINVINRKYATAAAWRPFLRGRGDWLRACFLSFCGRRNRLFGRAVVRLLPTGQAYPVYCRLGTSDFVTFQEIFFTGEYRWANDIPSEAVKGILDLGANVGLAARWFLEKFPDASVVAVEPDADNAAMARRNLLAIAPDSRHRVVHAFAGGISRLAFLGGSGGHAANEGALQDSPVTGKRTVPVMTGNEICDLAGCRLDIAKIDIEGSEKELLEADVYWLRSFRWIFIEVHDPLDEAWLGSVVSQGLPNWTVVKTERRHAGAFLAFLENRDPAGLDACG